MKQRNRPILLLVISLLFLAPSFLWAQSQGQTFRYDQAKVILPRQVIQVDIADTQEKRTLGLGFRSHLPQGRGMLFIFEQRELHGFWMKNMSFPIDIIWLDNYRIIHIEPNIQPSPEGEPLPTFKPDKLSNFVLEIGAGEAKRMGLEVGQKLKYQFAP
ncbi:DUF192 domain-containing protein [Deltaproteobacteria bacterium TL4]